MERPEPEVTTKRGLARTELARVVGDERAMDGH